MPLSNPCTWCSHQNAKKCRDQSAKLGHCERFRTFYDRALKALPEFEKHINSSSATITPEFQKFVNDDVLENHNYIICPDRSNKQKSYCSLTGKLFINHEKKQAHLSTFYCFQCPHHKQCPKATCTRHFEVHHLWRGNINHSCFSDALVLHFYKSTADASALVGEYVDVKRGFNHETGEREEAYTPFAFYLFRAGQKPQMAEIRFSYSGKRWMAMNPNMTNIAERTTSYNYHEIRIDAESFRQTVKGTPFQYACVDELELLASNKTERYKRVDETSELLKYLKMFSLHPWIETLVKSNLRPLVEASIFNRVMKEMNPINWASKSIKNALGVKLNKLDFKTISSINVKDYEDEELAMIFSLFKAFRHCKVNIQLEDMFDFSRQYKSFFESRICRDADQFGLLQKLIKDGTIKFHGLLRIAEMESQSDYLDYLADAIKLKLNLHDTAILFPKHLKMAQANLVKQISYLKDVRLDVQIKKRLPHLQKLFCYTQKDFLAKPAESCGDLIAEGKYLGHCVGSYTFSYADGRTNIIFIRKPSKPDEPLYTMEIKMHRQDEKVNEYRNIIKYSPGDRFKITQYRGLRNCEPSEDAWKFAQKLISEVNRRWKEKLAAQELQKKVKVPA